MPISRIARVGRVARAGQGGLADLPHMILTITDDGSNNGLITTAASHGLIGGESIVISGASRAGYNGPASVGDIVSPTSFLWGGGVYLGDSTGGTWALA